MSKNLGDSPDEQDSDVLSLLYQRNQQTTTSIASTCPATYLTLDWPRFVVMERGNNGPP